MTLSPGTIIANRYRVDAIIGSGGMGTVYQVKNISLEKEFALKVIDIHQQTEKAIRRFQLEARTTAQLKHPNLVEVHDFGIFQDTHPYLVMDLIKGKTLADILKTAGALEVKYVIPLAIELAKGLKYAHSIKVVHRDIKPGNIIVLNPNEKPVSGSVKIVDFGIAKIVQNDEGQIQELTKTGEIFGSPIYMSPEQCQGAAVDKRTDIYSLGCVLFECLTGSPPFLAENAMSTMVKRLTHQPETLKEGSLGMEFPEALEEVIRRMLQLEPADRYQDLDDLIDDLQEIKESTGLGSTTRAVAVVAPAVPKQKSWFGVKDWCAVAVTAVLFSLGTHFVDENFVLPSFGRANIATTKPIVQSHGNFGLVDGNETIKYPQVIRGSRNEIIGIDFPTDCGFIAVGRARKQPARGRIMIPSGIPVKLELSQDVITGHRLLSNLVDVNFYSINFEALFLAETKSLEGLEGMKHLRYLIIAGCEGITSIEPIKHLACLRGLLATGTAVPSSEIIQMENLQIFDRLGFGPVTDPETVLNAVRDSQSLNTLYYQGPSAFGSTREKNSRGLHPSDIDILAKFPSLERLSLKNCPDINDRTVSQLSKIKTLKQLSLNNCGVTPKGIPALAGLHLRELQMSGPNWTQQDAAALLKNVPHSKLEEYRLSGLDSYIGGAANKASDAQALGSELGDHKE